MKSTVKVFEKLNQPNYRGKIDNCQLCNQKFGFGTRQHQCKRCLRSICDNCGKDKKEVYKTQDQKMVKKPHRLCKVCSQQRRFIQQQIKNNNLVFGVASDIGRKWSKKIQSKQSGSFQKLQINQSKNSGRFSKDVFKQMWNSYNYSFKQFIGLMTFHLKQDNVHQKINNVYQKILKQYPDQKMENICYIIIYLLCYCDEHIAIKIVLFLLQLKRTVIQSKQLINFYLTKLGMKQDQIKKTSDYVKMKSKKFLNNYSLNLVTVQASIFLINKLIERKKIQEVYIMFSLVIFINKDFLIKNKNSQIDCDVALFKYCSLDKITDNSRTLGQIRTHNFIKNQLPNAKFQAAKSQFQKSQSDQNDRFEDFMSVKSRDDKKNNADFKNLNKKEEDYNIHDNRTFMKKKNIQKQLSSSPDDTQSQIYNFKKGFDQKSISNLSTKTFDFQGEKLSPIRKNTSDNKRQKAIYIDENQEEKQDKYSDIKFKKIPTMESKHSNASSQNSPIRLFASLIPNQEEKQECLECSKHISKIKDLQMQISNKDLEIQNLQMRIRLQIQNKSKDTPKFSDMAQTEDQNQYYQQCVRLQDQLRQTKKKLTNSEQQRNKLEKQVSKLESQVRKYQNQKQIVSKIRQQNAVLKNQVEELNLTIKMLKNKLQSASLVSNSTASTKNSHGIIGSAESGMSDPQLKKMNEMLKSTLMQKNNQIQNLIKQSKLLTYQIETFSNNDESLLTLKKQKAESQKKNKQLMKKIQQLSELLLKQEAQKLQLSDEVFEYKQAQKQFLNSKEDRTKSMTAVGSQKSSQCGIF